MSTNKLKDVHVALLEEEDPAHGVSLTFSSKDNCNSTAKNSLIIDLVCNSAIPYPEAKFVEEPKSDSCDPIVVRI